MSMMDPEGAVTLQNVVVPVTIQKLASDCFGGFVMMKAGRATDTVVSEASKLGVLENPTQSTEHVALAP